MHQTYSKYETKFEVEPELELQANETVNQLGKDYVLEGAKKIGNNFCKIWYRNIYSPSIGWINEPIRDVKQTNTQEVSINYVEPDILNLASWVVENQGKQFELEGAKKTGDGYCRIWMRNLITDELESISCPLDQKIEEKAENIEQYEKISEIVETKNNDKLPLVDDFPSEFNSEYFIFYNE